MTARKPSPSITNQAVVAAVFSLPLVYVATGLVSGVFLKILGALLAIVLCVALHRFTKVLFENIGTTDQSSENDAGNEKVEKERRDN